MLKQYQIRVFKLFNAHWIITMETEGSRVNFISRSLNKRKVCDVVVGLSIVEASGTIGDYSYQIDLANRAVAQDEVKGAPTILSVSLLAVCGDLWYNVGPVHDWATEIKNPAELAPFLTFAKGFAP